MDVLGLDIGGANLKAAHTGGMARTVPFALWKAPRELPVQLKNLLAPFPSFDQLAVTMTGELCDCFANKRQGVATILASVQEASSRPIRVYSHRGHFVDVAEALAQPLTVASANWHAQAYWAARFTNKKPALLLDIGSTTTDLIPILNGKPAPRGLTDSERLQSRELCYTGVRRTPVCAILPAEYAAEWFATMHDVYLVLGDVAEDPLDLDTADGRPALQAFAENRLARMACADQESMSQSAIEHLAEKARDIQVQRLAEAMDKIVLGMPQPPTTVIVSGSGAFLHRPILKTRPQYKDYGVLVLAKQATPNIATAACAYAVAILAKEQP